VTAPLVLVVEDDASMRRFLRASLGSASFRVIEATSSKEAIALAANQNPELVLLDLGLPDGDGIEVTRRLREWSAVPIIVLSARTDEADKVAGLEAWVDDYVTKPFSPRELKARVKAVLRRRAPEAAQEALEVGPMRLDPVTHRATVAGNALELGPTEFRLLRFFLARPERVHTRAQLLDQVWGDQVYIEERTVDVHIRRLRLALEPHGCDAMIETVRGTGYRLAAPR
jgi:two-component system phosphate regulon response regulator PhoB